MDFKKNRRKVMIQLLALSSVTSLPLIGKADNQAGGTRRIVVGYGAGGVTDLLARIIANDLQTELGHAYIVENKPGAGGNIASDSVARAFADGNTLLCAALAFAVNPSISSVRYNPVKDFSPVALLTQYPIYVVVHPSMPDTIEDLIALAKSKPGQLNYASAGFGTSPHLGAKYFAKEAGIKITHIPYRGGIQAVSATAAGETQIHFGASVLPLVKSGKLKLIAVTSKERLSHISNIPTISETLPDFEIVSWNGLFAPAGTDSDTIRNINHAINRILQKPKVISTLRDAEMEVSPGPPEKMAEILKRDYEMWAKTTKSLGINIR